MGIFGKEKSPDDPRAWTLRYEGKDYVADSFAGVKQWYRDGHVPFGCQIFDPDNGEWTRPETLIPRIIADVRATTTPSIDGCRIRGYLGIESVEIVIGTGFFSEFSGDMADFFGQRSTAFEEKLQRAKKMALEKLRLLAFRQGGDAVVGVDLD